MVPSLFGFLEWFAAFGSASLGRCYQALRSAHGWVNSKKRLSINMKCILLCVKFEGGLINSVLRKRELEIEMIRCLSNSATPYILQLPVNPFSLLLLYFFITFFFPPTTASHQKLLALYKATFNDERRVTPSFPPSCPSFAYQG
jgi:hypothetical protein